MIIVMPSDVERSLFRPRTTRTPMVAGRWLAMCGTTEHHGKTIGLGD